MSFADMGQSIANRVHQIHFDTWLASKRARSGGQHRGTLRHGRDRVF